MPKNTNSQIFLSWENLRIAAGNNQHLKNGKFQKLTTIPLFNSLLFKTQSYVLRYCLNYLFIFVAVCFVFVLNADPVKSESFHSFFLLSLLLCSKWGSFICSSFLERSPA